MRELRNLMTSLAVSVSVSIDDGPIAAHHLADRGP
jgi:hypothetical protein